MTRTVVIVPAPTANGDLHIGHVCGPFLAADVFARHQRGRGRETLFATGVQETQTFVTTTARRLGVDAGELCARSAADVRRTLAATGMSIDGFAPGDERFRRFLVDFVARLRDAGRLRLRSMPFPWSPRTGEFLVDGHVRGTCPTCLADSCGGVCESCGHPLDPGALLDPRSTASPGDPVETREAEVLALPLEEYRDELVAYFDRPGRVARPHMMQAVREMLAAPLGDFPVTYPISWGVPAPFPEVAGQVINPAAEAMPAGIYSTTIAAESRGAVLGSDDELWLAGSGTRVVYFCGFDNTQPFAIAGLAMLLAHGGRYLLPEALLTNEFYELDHEKFSTSRGHVVWGAELAAEAPRDGIRFFLASTSPEHQRTNFNRHALATVVQSRLVEPWNRVASVVGAWLDEHAGDGPRPVLPVSARAHAEAAVLRARFAATCELEHFSLNRTAELITAHLARLEDLASRVRPGADRQVALGDLCHLIEVFVRCAAPVLVDLADLVLGDLGGHAIDTPAEPATVLVRRLPLLARMDEAEPLIDVVGRAG